MRVLALQTETAWEDPSHNFQAVRQQVEQVKPQPGELLILPEMFACGFSMNTAKVAEEENGATATFLSELAREFSMLVIGGVPLREGGGFRNSALVFDARGQRVLRYDKIRPFTYGEEGEHYEAGGNLASFSWNGFRAVPFICYDLRFPELFRRAVFQAGAELFLVLANWPAVRVDHWRALLVARAIENQAYVVGVNRVGRDPQVAYSGSSLIVSPRGEVVADGREERGAIEAVLNREALIEYRASFPALQDGRALLQLQAHLEQTAPR